MKHLKFDYRCDPKKLYQFFLKATQIEAIIEKLNACFASGSNSKAQLANMNKTMKVVEKDLNDLQQKYIRLKSVDNIRVCLNKFLQFWFFNKIFCRLVSTN